MLCVLYVNGFAQSISKSSYPAIERVEYSALPNSDSVVNMVEAGADPSGVLPADSVLESCIRTISNKHKVLYFPAGTYLFTRTIKLRSNVIIRGKHADSTVFIFNLNGRHHAIEVRGVNNSQPSYLQKGIRTGENEITVSEGNLRSGQTIMLVQNDSSWITSSWAKNTIGQFMTVDSLAGNTITLDKKIRHNYFKSLQPRISTPEFVNSVGIENIKMIRRDATSSQTSHVFFQYAKDCWIYGLHFDSANFGHVTFDRSYRNLVTGSFFENAFDFGGGGKAYGVVLQNTSSDNVIENNIFRNLRHSMLLQSGANGNIVSYNYSVQPFWTSTFFPASYSGDLVLHGNYVYANLFEGNVVQNIVIDNSHGMNGPRNVFLRNRAEHAGIYMNSSQVSDSQLFIGNEITASGSHMYNNIPFPKGMYSLAGTGHFEYGNNQNGKLIPEPVESMTSSYYLGHMPEFWLRPGTWPAIGFPNDIGGQTIAAQQRFEIGEKTVPRTIFQPPVKPIELTAFQNEKEEIVIEWSMAETNQLPELFVQRMNRINGEFQDLGTVAQPRKSGSNLYFEFTDRAPEIGENVYRIKQKDAHGTIRYSTHVVVEFKKAASAELFNEMGSNVWWLMNEIESEKPPVLTVYDLSGREMKELSLVEASNQKIDLNGFIPGVYLIKIQLENSSSIEKVRVH